MNIMAAKSWRTGRYLAKFGALTFGLVATLTLQLFTVTPASANPYNNIKNYASQRCIGVSGGNAGIWDCTNGPDQLWTVHYSGEWFQIEDKYNLCLSTSLTPTAGDMVLGSTCVNYPWQLWKFGDYLNWEGHAYYRLINKANQSLVLGTHAGSTGNGTQLVVYTKVNHTDQYWWPGW